jgi:hypothetical protein
MSSDLLVERLQSLRRLRQVDRDSGCELCSEPLSPEHRHVVDVEHRRLLCVCRACALLFEHPGAGARQRRTVPDRVVAVGSPVDGSWWRRLAVPVGLAFFVVSDDGTPTAWYPGPAGATQAELEVADWDALVGAHPEVAAMAPEVEALLIRSRPLASHHLEALVVPVDACYQLVGILRQCWRGFDGGADAHAAVEGWWAALAARAGSLQRGAS